jgi:predicted nucleotidyltransferase
MDIDIEVKYQEIIKDILAKYLQGKRVWAYGSRVNRTAGRSSDLDLVVFGATDTERANALEAFENSSLPFTVSIMTWERIPDDFKENIQKKYVVLQNKLQNPSTDIEKVETEEIKK